MFLETAATISTKRICLTCISPERRFNFNFRFHYDFNSIKKTLTIFSTSVSFFAISVKHLKESGVYNFFIRSTFDRHGAGNTLMNFPRFLLLVIIAYTVPMASLYEN